MSFLPKGVDSHQQKNPPKHLQRVRFFKTHLHLSLSSHFEPANNIFVITRKNREINVTFRAHMAVGTDK